MQRHVRFCGLLFLLLSLLVLSSRAFPQPTSPPDTPQRSPCPPPATYAREQLPSVKLTLQPSRPQLTVGGPWSITGLIENQSEASIYLVNRFTALTLPVEILGAHATTMPAIFPTTEGALTPPADVYQVVGVFPKHTYQVVWHVRPRTWVHRLAELLAHDTPDWSQFLPGLWSDLRQALFFHPYQYQVVALLQYWKENPQAYLECMQQPSLQIDMSMAPSVVTTMLVDIEASTWVILLGAWFGSIAAYFFQVFMGKRRGSLSGFAGACLLGPIVSLFLKRLGDTAFVVTLNVNDLWGAIVIGYIAQYTGLQIIDHFVTKGPASDAPPAYQPPPAARSDG